MIRGGGSVAISTGAIGNVVEICLKISRVGLKVSKSGVSRLNHLSTLGPVCFPLVASLLPPAVLPPAAFEDGPGAATLMLPVGVPPPSSKSLTGRPGAGVSCES